MSDDVTSRLRLVVPPVSEPVALNEAKLFLRIEHEAEDAVIVRAIANAREACEHYLGIALLPQAWRYQCASAGALRVVLPFGPVSAIDAVTVTRADAEVLPIGESAFRLSIDGFTLIFSHALPAQVLAVEYVAAYADSAAALPALLKQGILHHVAALLEQREGQAPMPLASLQCYQPFRRVRL